VTASFLCGERERERKRERHREKDRVRERKREKDGYIDREREREEREREGEGVWYERKILQTASSSKVNARKIKKNSDKVEKFEIGFRTAGRSNAKKVYKSVEI